MQIARIHRTATNYDIHAENVTCRNNNFEYLWRGGKPWKSTF